MTQEGGEVGSLDLSSAPKATKKRAHTTITTVESATRYWLSAQVMVACIMLVLLALTIQNSRKSVENFPNTLNSTCVSSVYTIQINLAQALGVLVDGVCNITNTQYKVATETTRTTLRESMEMTTSIFLLVIKQIHPTVYCALEGGLYMTSAVQDSIKDIIPDIPEVSCSTSSVSNAVTGAVNSAGNAVSSLISFRDEPRDVNGSFDAIGGRGGGGGRKRSLDDLCEIANALNTVTGGLKDVIRSWPQIPSTLTEVVTQILAEGGFDQLIDKLANFTVPKRVLYLDTAKIVADAMASTTEFNETYETCGNMSVKFTTATNRTVRVMYIIEIVIWVSIVVLLLGIFLVSIVRQFPNACVTMISRKFESLTKSWEDRLDISENTTTSNTKLYIIWTLRYINFKKALLTTAYGLLGILLVYNLAAITDDLKKPLEIWIDESMGPSLNILENQLQSGIDGALSKVEDELNDAMQHAIKTTLEPIEDTLNEILVQKTKYVGRINSLVTDIYATPVVGPPIAQGIICMSPIMLLNIVDTGANLFLTVVQRILNVTISIPRFTFPSMVAIASRSTNVALNYMATSIQDELYQYQIIFIILSISFGILVFQGLFFVSMKKLIARWKVQRREVNVHA